MGNADVVFDLSARISVDDRDVSRTLSRVSNQADNLAKKLGSLDISKMKVGNLSADYDKFTNALKNNSVAARKGADDFLNLFNKVSSGKGHIATAAHEASRLGESFKVLSSAAVIADGPLGGIASRIRAMGTEAKEANSVFGSTAGIFVGVGLAGAGAAVGLFELALKSAELGKSILETSEKTNFTTEAISAMRIPAEQTGLGLDRLGDKLAGFNVSIGNAQLGQKAFSKAFKDMGVDIKQGVEPALDQFLKKFQEMGPTSQRNALEAKIFRDRTGELIPFLEKLGGSLEQAKQRAKELGLSFDEESAKASRDFADRVTLMKLGLEGFANRVGQQITPQITGALKDIGSALGNNENSWSGWADFVATQMNRVLIGARMLAQDIGRTMDGFRTFLSFGSTVAGAVLSGTGGANPSAFGSYWPAIDQSFNANSKWLNNRENAREDPSLIWKKWTPPGAKADGAGTQRIRTAGGGGGGGSDPAATAKRLAEINLKIVLDDLKAEENALTRSLSTRRSSLEDYTTKAIDLATRERKATIDALDVEQKEAARLKKGGAVALAEIGLKRQEIERKSAESVTKYIDALLDDVANRDRLREEGMLRVHEIVGKQESDLWQALADQRTITQETAVRAIGQIEMKGLVERMAIARSEFARAGNDKTKQLEASMKMGEIESQIGALSAENERKAANALRGRLAAQRDFNASLEQTLGNIQLQSLELQKQGIQHKGDVSGKMTSVARRSIDRIDIEGADLQNQIAKRQLFLNLLKDMDGKSFAERTQLYAQFVKARDLLEQQHAQVVKEIQDRPLIELAEKMRPVAENIANILSNSILTGFEHGAKAGFDSFLQGFTQMLAQMAEQMLASAIFNLLMKFLGGIGGGGGGAAAIAGQGIAGAAAGIHFASGGIVPGIDRGYDSVPAMLEPGERVLTRQQQQQIGGHTYNLTVNYNAAPNEQPASRQTVYQMSKQLHGLVAKAVLTG